MPYYDDRSPLKADPARLRLQHSTHYLLLLGGSVVRVHEGATRWRHVGERCLLTVEARLLPASHALLARPEFWRGDGRKRVAVIAERHRVDRCAGFVRVFTGEEIARAAALAA
jgi:hypothetical protein